MADQLEAPPLTAGVDEESKMNVPYILANGEPNMEHPVLAWRASLPEGEPFTTELASAVLSKPKVKVTIGLPHQDSGLPVNALAGMMGCVMAGLEPEDSDERLLTVPKIFEGELPTLDAIESAYRYDYSEDRVAEHVALARRAPPPLTREPRRHLRSPFLRLPPARARDDLDDLRDALERRPVSYTHLTLPTKA